MSNTIRIYWREYGTGKVGLDGGWGQTSIGFVRHRLTAVAMQYALEIDAKVQQDSDGGLHVIKTEKHRAVGRCYFMADSPLQIPLGEGWEVLENADGTDGTDIVFGYSLKGQDVRLRWQALSQDEIDNQHGNDEFGGWAWPTIYSLSDPNSSHELTSDQAGEDAVMLMMLDIDRVGPAFVTLVS